MPPQITRVAATRVTAAQRPVKPADTRSTIAVGGARQGAPRPHPPSREKIMNRRNTLAAISASLLAASAVAPAVAAAREYRERIEFEGAVPLKPADTRSTIAV